MRYFLGLQASENLPLVSSFENLAVTHLYRAQGLASEYPLGKK
jgi:hypothetical protein